MHARKEKALESIADEHGLPSDLVSLIDHFHAYALGPKEKVAALRLMTQSQRAWTTSVIQTAAKI